jgi:hypothetical protein
MPIHAWRVVVTPNKSSVAEAVHRPAHRLQKLSQQFTTTTTRQPASFDRKFLQVLLGLASTLTNLPFTLYPENCSRTRRNSLLAKVPPSQSRLKSTFGLRPPSLFDSSLFCVRRQCYLCYRSDIFSFFRSFQRYVAPSCSLSLAALSLRFSRGSRVTLRKNLSLTCNQSLTSSSHCPCREHLP